MVQNPSPAPEAWQVPECPFAIEYDPDLLDEIRRQAVSALLSLPHGGAEIGGVLFGSREDGRVRLQAHRLIECQYAFGPSFVLSDSDLAGLARLLEGARRDPALAGLGTINNIGVHAYDLLRYLLSSEVTAVTAMLDTGRAREIETLALVLLRFANGTLAYVNANQKTPHPQADIDIYGTRGRIVGHHLTRPGLDGELRVLTEKGEAATPYSNRDAYQRVVAAFNDAVLHRREPRASGLDGLRSVQLTEAIARSAREGVLVELRY